MLKGPEHVETYQERARAPSLTCSCSWQNLPVTSASTVQKSKIAEVSDGPDRGHQYGMERYKNEQGTTADRFLGRGRGSRLLRKS